MGIDTEHQGEQRFRAVSAEQELAQPEFPVMPELVESVMSLNEALTLAGIDPETTFRSDEADYWGSSGHTTTYESEDGMGTRSDHHPATAQLARRTPDGRWEIGTAIETGEDATTTMHVAMRGKYGRPVDVVTKSLLHEMAVPAEDRQRIAEEVARRRTAADESYRQQIATNLRDIFSRPESHALPLQLTQSVRRLGTEEYIEHGIDDLGSGVGVISEVAKLHDAMPAAYEAYEREQRGEILVNWGGYNRLSGSDNKQGLHVLDEEGNFVPPTEVDHRSQVSTWELVGPSELAVSWRMDTLRSPFVCKIDKKPYGTDITEAQQQALRELEQKFDMPVGSFETDEVLIAQRQAVLDAIRAHDELNKLLQHHDDSDDVRNGGESNLYNALVSDGGFMVENDTIDIPYTADQSTQTYKVDGRDGVEVMRTQVTPYKAVQVLKYRKYGRDNNLSVKLIDSEAPVSPPSEEPPATTVKSDGTLDLSALQGRFSRQ